VIAVRAGAARAAPVGGSPFSTAAAPCERRPGRVTRGRHRDRQVDPDLRVLMPLHRDPAHGRRGERGRLPRGRRADLLQALGDLDLDDEHGHHGAQGIRLEVRTGSPRDWEISGCERRPAGRMIAAAPQSLRAGMGSPVTSPPRTGPPRRADARGGPQAQGSGSRRPRTITVHATPGQGKHVVNVAGLPKHDV